MGSIIAAAKIGARVKAFCGESHLQHSPEYDEGMSRAAYVKHQNRRKCPADRQDCRSASHQVLLVCGGTL